MFISRVVVSLCIATAPAFAVAQNTAVQYQLGTANQTWLQQDGGVGNLSLQFQHGPSNLSQTTQTGDYNQAHVRQRSSFSEAQVTQNGNYNQTRIYQGGTDWPMKEGGSDWSAEVVQLGNANQVALQQDQGFGSRAYLHQEGDRNVHQVRQDGYPNRLEVSSAGDDNHVVVNQIDGFGISRVTQLGDAHQVSIEQWVFPNSGTVEIAQHGVANQASIRQKALWRPVGTLVLEQVGSSNLMAIYHGEGAYKFRFIQEGEGNRLDAVQSGPILSFEGHSTGNRNQVNVVQIYYDAELTISQIGDDNSIQTEQYDLHTKAAAINQIGDFNHAVLGQTAGFTSNQVATITQQGNGNRATALQQ